MKVMSTSKIYWLNFYVIFIISWKMPLIYFLNFFIVFSMNIVLLIIVMFYMYFCLVVRSNSCDSMLYSLYTLNIVFVFWSWVSCYSSCISSSMKFLCWLYCDRLWYMSLSYCSYSFIMCCFSCMTTRYFLFSFMVYSLSYRVSDESYMLKIWFSYYILLYGYDSCINLFWLLIELYRESKYEM